MSTLIATPDEPEQPKSEPTEAELIELYKHKRKSVLTDTVTVVANHGHRKQNLSGVATVLKAPAQNAVDTLSAAVPA